MSGVTPLIDTLLATRLAQRVDLVPLKAQSEIAGPSAVAATEKATNDVRLPSRVALDQQLGMALPDRGFESPAALVSARTTDALTLSALARSLRAILMFPTGAGALRVYGSQPLWTGLQPMDARLMGASLAHTVATSGLFYESHLLQFVAGLRPLELMLREPQAGLALSPVPAAPINTAIVPLATARPDDAAAAASTGIAAASLAAASAVDANAAQGGPTQLPAVYGRGGRPATSAAPFHEIVGQAPDAKTPLASLAGAADTSSEVAAAVHPDAIAMVRQQLELLSLPVFRWSGEAWPGTAMNWDIQEDQAEDAGNSREEASQPAWTTNLTMTLPTLKSVQARLTLSGSTLQLRLACDDDLTLAVLLEARDALSRRFGPLGLQLTTLKVGLTGVEDGRGLPK